MYTKRVGLGHRRFMLGMPFIVGSSVEPCSSPDRKNFSPLVKG